MNKRRWLLHIFERAHEPTPEQEAHLQRSLIETVPDGRASQRLLQGLDAPDAGIEQRLMARLDAIPREVPRRVPLLSPTPGRLALAGAAALGLGLVVVHGLDPEPEPLATTLAEQATPADLDPFPGVHLAYNGGYGELGGTTRSPAIQWIAGELEVEVEPNRGINLAVQTEEATVRVIGTRFTVDRQDAETKVSVQRGKVEVTCSDGERVQLTADQNHRCLSQSPSKLALRAVRMEQRGADPGEVLAVVERGLANAQEGEAAWSHLSVLRMKANAQLGQRDEALGEAQRYLADGHDRRRLEVLRLALDLSEAPCPIAARHQSLLGAETAAPADLVLLSDCLRSSDLSRSRALLERALGAPGLALDERAAVQERLEQLR
jgi:hypothetical protein